MPLKHFLNASLLLAVITPCALCETPATKADIAPHFRWSYRKAHELNYKRTIANSTVLTASEKAELLNAVGKLVRPFIEDSAFTSSSEFQKLLQATRLELVDLNGDGVAEAIVQASDYRISCGATGNCALWVFKKTPKGYRLILDTRGSDGIGGIELLTVGTEATNGFKDLVLAAHDSASEKTLYVYRYSNGRYREHECYYATWQVSAGGELRELKQPQIGPCAP